MWSVGCIAAELLLRVPFIQGTSDLDQLSKVILRGLSDIFDIRKLEIFRNTIFQTFEALGSPTDETWPDVRELPDYVEYRFSPGFPLEGNRF